MVSYLDVDQGTAINAKLYNMTDNVSFNNSLVSSNSSLPVIVYSRNIYNDLPKKDIDLGVELYSDVEGKGGAISYSYLILYRK
jgi:hypothetical protein